MFTTRGDATARCAFVIGTLQAPDPTSIASRAAPRAAGRAHSISPETSKFLVPAGASSHGYECAKGSPGPGERGDIRARVQSVLEEELSGEESKEEVEDLVDDILDDELGEDDEDEDDEEADDFDEDDDDENEDDD